MKKLALLAVLLSVLAALFIVTPLGVIYDPPPAPSEVAGTVLIEQPAAEVEMAEPPGPPTPLGRLLRVTQPVDVAVPQGLVRLPAGLDVELRAENARDVDVSMGAGKLAAIVTVPREAVANRGELPLPIFAPIARASQALVDLTHAPAGSFAVEAHEIGTGKGVARDWETDYGSYSKHGFRTKGLEVRVRNLSRRASGDLRVTAYWVSARRLKDNTRHITHAETFSSSLAPVTEQSFRSWCPILDEHDTKFVLLGERYRSGSKFDGWFVLVERDGQMLVGRGASETFNTIIRDADERQSLVATWAGSKQRATASMPSWRKERPGYSAIPIEKRGVSAGSQ